MSKSVTAVVKSTGEIIEFDTSTPEAIVESIALLNETVKAYERAKAKLQDAARDIVNSDGTFEHNGYLLRVSSVQRQQYDMAVLREVFDEDELALFMEPAKGRIDAYIKEHLDELGEQSTRLRTTMVASGNPYTVVRLERL